MTEEILFGLPNKKPKRFRTTKAGLVERREKLFAIVEAAQPATVRQIFYLASVRGTVTKDESGYDRVQGDLLAMCRAIDAAYDIDEVKSIHDQAAMLQAAARVAHNVDAETRAYEIRMRAARKAGELSKKIERASANRGNQYKVANPHNAGQPKGAALEKAGISTQRASDWERLAAVPQDEFETALAKKTIPDLLLKPTPVSDELDAIGPNRLRTLVEEVIVWHLPPDQYAILIEAEKSERTLFQGLAGLVKQLAQRRATDAGSSP